MTFPLTVLGGIAGKNTKTEFYAPCRTNKYPREIPALPWYRHTLPQMCMAGFLPFSAIYIELYYIFASVWGHKVRACRGARWFVGSRVGFGKSEWPLSDGPSSPTGREPPPSSQRNDACASRGAREPNAASIV